MDKKSEARLKQKLTTATEILTWELADMWGHVSARTADGEKIEEACVNMVRLERTARMILAAAAAGRPAAIPAAAADKFHSIIGKDSTEISPDHRPAVSQIAEWHYYEHLIKKGRRWSRL